MKSQYTEAECSDDEQQFNIDMQSGLCGFKANGCKQEDRQNKPVTTVTDTSKSFRLLEPGVMLEGTCRTEGCHAFGKKALHICGFVTKINFASQRYEAVCRLCKQQLENADNIGYFQTTLKLRGKYLGVKGIVQMEYTADDGRYHTFRNGEEQQVMWEFLDITAEKLGK